MPEDDFMGSSFRNYDTTENRMSGSNATTGRGSCNHGECDNTVDTGRAILGLAVLIIGLVIVAAMKETLFSSALGCFIGLIIIAGIFAATFAIWRCKG